MSQRCVTYAFFRKKNPRCDLYGCRARGQAATGAASALGPPARLDQKKRKRSKKNFGIFGFDKVAGEPSSAATTSVAGQPPGPRLCELMRSPLAAVEIYVSSRTTSVFVAQAMHLVEVDVSGDARQT